LAYLGNDIPNKLPSGIYIRARPASSSPGILSQALVIQHAIPIKIQRIAPHQGTGDSCLGSGECPTFSPHFGQAFKEAEKRTLQAWHQ